MKIYYRELPGWHKAGQVGSVGDYERSLLDWCEKHLGRHGIDSWNTFRPPRTKLWVRPEGIVFHKDEYATAFLLVHK